MYHPLGLVLRRERTVEKEGTKKDMEKTQVKIKESFLDKVSFESGSED